MKKRKHIAQKEKEFFDKLAEETGEIFWGARTYAGILRMKRRAKLISNMIQNKKTAKVLEIGCGTGALTKFILQEIPGLKLTGNDIAPKAIKLSQQRFLKNKNSRFEVMDVTKMKYPANSFNYVIGNSILHHVPLEKALQECFRALKPGGKIWFSEPNMMNPQIALEKNVRFIGKWLQNTEDETAFFRASLAKKLQQIGFINVSVIPFDFMHPVIPKLFVPLARFIERILENTPLLKEISGSLLITAGK